jgi:hypothetical protein
MATMAKRHEFRVVIENVDLPEEVVGRINQAVQKAALGELATVDLEGDLRVSRPWGRRPPWIWGIWFDRLSEDELKRAGLAAPRDFQEGKSR